MDDAEIPKVPGEISPELVPVVSLNALDGQWEALTDLVEEGDGGGDRALRIDLQHAIPGGLVNSRKLIEAAAA